MESRLIHIEYETEDNRNNLGVSMLSIREDDLKTISLSTSCGARVTFTREEIMKALTYWQKTQSFRPKEDPRHDSVYQRLEALEKDVSLNTSQIAALCRLQCKDALDIDELEKKVGVLEVQHREIPPDPENYFAIELGHPFKTIYVRKPVDK